MKFFKILKIFDKLIVVCNSIIHYVDVYFKIFVARKNVRLIRFYIIELFHWSIVFEISWFIKNKININFEKIIVEIFIAIEQLTFDISIFLKKIRNKLSIRLKNTNLCSWFSLTKTICLLTLMLLTSLLFHN